jgi:hypothetical protein
MPPKLKTTIKKKKKKTPVKIPILDDQNISDQDSKYLQQINDLEEILAK